LTTTDETADSMRDALIAVRDRKNWDLDQLPDKLIWRTEAAGAEGSYTCYVQVDPELGQLVFYGIVPHTVAPEDRVESAVALAGVNYGLAVGNFELDLIDGELRFSTGIDVTGTRLEPIVLERMIDNALEMLDAYTPKLRRKVPLPDEVRSPT
jgi:hypothetical protein